MEERHWKIVQDILNKYPYTFYAFGSRVKGTHKQFSDLDLCFKESIPLNVQGHINEDFEESNLPFKVDVLDWNLITPKFQEIIKKDLVPIEKHTHHAKTHH
ncbi:MAG: nucleotidyltransferase domain-containing protein [Proteobacteria bacterium]|nr:nucleotidyltransferase domain-containing protein [Pseudomonadota bacterium]